MGERSKMRRGSDNARAKDRIRYLGPKVRPEPDSNIWFAKNFERAYNATPVNSRSLDGIYFARVYNINDEGNLIANNHDRYGPGKLKDLKDFIGNLGDSQVMVLVEARLSRKVRGKKILDYMERE